MKYAHTRLAGYLGCVTQAVVNTFPPLLFLTFQRQFGLSMGMLTGLITLNFTVQLLVDLAASRFADRIGYRACAVAAHVFCAAGLLAMGSLPFALPSPYIGLVVATLCTAIGGGLIEVIVSPIVEALPGEHKAASMSLLHSFYCWGYLLVALLSTLYFSTAGMASWPFLPLLWALLPLGNSLLFARVPIKALVEESQAAIPLRKLFTKKLFLMLFLFMLCAGASEQAMSQWASLFAELGLGVSKTMGDLLGPCVFAALMGTARVLSSTGLRRFNIQHVLLASGLLCLAAYLLTVFSPWPLVSLLGCGLCGFAVGVMWPGTLSLASRRFPLGGTAMFAILALAGDAGCATGPALVGIVSGFAKGGQQAALKAGLLAAVVFPLVLALGLLALRRALSARTAADSSQTF